MRYIEHPLNKLSDNLTDVEADSFDHTPDNFKETIFPSVIQQFKNSIGNYIYPLKNKLEYKKSLQIIDSNTQSLSGNRHKPDVIAFGPKGTGNELFYRRVASTIKQRDVVLNFGCGLGYELILTAKYLQPKKIIGCDYFSYSKAWQYVSALINQKYGCEVEFYQVDLRNEHNSSIPPADLLLSFSVLEHLKEMDNSLFRLKEFLKPNGHFASLWGPMWYSYSGDHIAGELGLECGYEHLLLSPEDYFEFYKKHPRNCADVKAGVKTWLELGLTNFATYDEYLKALTHTFGEKKFLLWQISREGLLYKKMYPHRWAQILIQNPHITEFDLLVTNASIII